MKIVDAIATILKHEGVKFLSCFPTTPMIQACAAAGIRPQVCAQERVGVGIADGYSRITNGHPVGVFAMQYGPGAENAFPGVATAFSDSTPVLLEKSTPFWNMLYASPGPTVRWSDIGYPSQLLSAPCASQLLRIAPRTTIGPVCGCQ